MAKQRRFTVDTYIVRHKNPDNPATKRGTVWAVDGGGEKWTKADAEEHARRCEYAALNIPYEIVPSHKMENEVVEGKGKE